MSGSKYKQHLQLRAKLEKERQAMDENAIAAALELATAPRYEGDAAQLCAIAKHAGMDQQMLTWWIRTPASRSADWSALALRNWTLQYSGLLSHITTGTSIAMCEQCHSHPARLMAGVWYCSGNCAPHPARQLPGPA